MAEIICSESQAKNLKGKVVVLTGKSLFDPISP